MNKKLRILMELHPCLHGFAGIPQETRLLFSYYSSLPSVQMTGLINVDMPHISLGKPYFISQKPHQKMNQSSQLVLSLAKTVKVSILNILEHVLRLGLASAKNKLGGSVPVHPFHSKGFEDFLWEQLFSKTLTTDEFEQVTQALFSTLQFSPYTLHLLKRFDHNYLKIDTKNHDVLFVQTPFPGRVAKNTQLVVRYHDAIPLFLPHLIHNSKSHQRSHYKALCSNAKSATFVCTSNDVRTDLLQVFPQLEKRAHVIHDTISPHYFEESASNSRLKQVIYNYVVDDNPTNEFYQNQLSQDPLIYIMMVSTIEPRKNHIRLIRAWESVCARLNLPLKLILVGELGWQFDQIVTAMKPWQRRGQLLHLQKVPVEHLRLLYGGAACVVCPSIKEGFDLSGVEAMACGGKVVASDIPVHREVYGDAAVYFDPYSFKEQAEVIESIVVSGNNVAEKLKIVGLKQAQRYQRDAILPQWADFFESMPRLS